ncbi:MAG: EAL domain-containing protein [Solirubrobacterales bacterium]
MASFVVVATFGVLTALHAGNSTAWTDFDDIVEALVAILAAVACGIRAQREYSAHLAARDLEDDSTAKPHRHAWIAWSLLAAGTGAWAIGQIGWTVSEVGLGVTPEAPSPLDAAFLLSPLLVVCGLLAMVRTPAGGLSQIRGAVEGLLIAGGLFTFSWTLVIAPVLTTSDTSLLGQVVNLAYPLLDAMALSAVLFVALRQRQSLLPGLGLLGVGIVCIALSDSAFWYVTSLDPKYPGVSPLGTGWVAGFLLIALAAHQPHGPPSWMRRLAPRRLALTLAPVPAALGVLAMLGAWLVGHGAASTSVSLPIVGALAIVALALLTIVAYENDALTDDLERQVDKRTAELRTTQRYYRALVRDSSDLIMVVGLDLRIRYVSDSMVKIFGYQPEQLVGRSLDVFGPVAGETLTEALEQIGLNPDRAARVGWVMNDADGRKRHAETTISNLLADPDVGAFVLNTRDDTDRVALSEQLRRQAFHDPLTGLPNRALLNDRAAQAFGRAARTEATVTVMAINLDAFKLVNDRFGHQAGDRLLRAVAERLQDAMRPGDTVARTGGDEFVVLIDSVAGSAEALRLAERLRAALGPVFKIDDSQHTVTASIGVTTGRSPATNFEQLLSEADVAMYTVKAAGKDAVQLFESSMHLQARKRFRLQSDLRDALDRREFWLLHQPQFNIKSEQLHGFEALIRWNHPKHGLLRPERFIPLAEETGLIVPLGRWVLREALREAATWASLDGSRPLTISVNVSAVQLGAPSLVPDLRDALGSTSIDPAQVVLEITETSLIDSGPRVLETLNGLKDLGVRVAIDDFGTGYASLASLQNMPIDILKIDRSFVTSSTDGDRGRELLEAIVNIGRILSLVTIAEGVEHAGHLSIVKDIGCDIVQGHLLGPPLAHDEAHRLIAERSTRRIPSLLS